MNSLKDEMFENQEKIANEKLAEILGVSYAELTACEWEIDDEHIENAVISFSEDSPEEILKKIGVDENKEVRVDLSNW